MLRVVEHDDGVEEGDLQDEEAEHAEGGVEAEGGEGGERGGRADDEGEEVDFYAIVARDDDDDHPEDGSENVDLARRSTASLERRAYGQERPSSPASASPTAVDSDDHGSAKLAEQVPKPVEENQSSRSAGQFADGHEPAGSDKGQASSQGVAKRALPLFEEGIMEWEDD